MQHLRIGCCFSGSFYALQTATPNLCVLASLDMAQVRAYLGISADGHLALIAMALLLGGDYHMRGAEKIGPKQVRPSVYPLHILHPP